LPFDRSSSDITAHALRAMQTVRARQGDAFLGMARPAERALRYLRKQQRADGSWTPLWFGNQDLTEEENPTYGTSRVLLALAEFADPETAGMARRGAEWLLANQNVDGGWGAGSGTISSVEETALALEGLAGLAVRRPAATPPKLQAALWRGAAWLVEKVESGAFATPNPIGFYFAKLWYFEALYPIIWTTAALGTAHAALAETSRRGSVGEIAQEANS
jgi:squalene-hopene/tetraprenyl-beta-curcumene cyclase